MCGPLPPVRPVTPRLRVRVLRFSRFSGFQQFLDLPSVAVEQENRQQTRQLDCVISSLATVFLFDHVADILHRHVTVEARQRILFRFGPGEPLCPCPMDREFDGDTGSRSKVRVAGDVGYFPEEI